ncbi:PAAT family amino acid ABC transporter substrate-binding protein [Stutzerimonas zhaodongensis]|uniref:PAAT family amino acid ABC transporter substrate-binding protein n=1 Tax=Stutzerimonas zhaodongensis TaxID=1176257 RepID=A0A3M2HLU0_9GAMM|nr:transporter substrate-binding domain-containing protein [Stutzerimonas zhaodongensis]MCQ4315305.1 transporter substrate-binding domain-containing protein [Stutzerimonas zhaodongensis]RMH90686.1 PAAT family amino acid ABC transporter substrate-binding protein [Stutzerimonas zhaodongensis]
MQRLALLLMFALLPLMCGAQQRVEVWTYHLAPPFIVDENQGLSRDFVKLLNDDPGNKGRFRFELTRLARDRVDLELERKRPGVLLWATPSFFSAALANNGRWSRPLLMDQQVFVSLPDAPFDYTGPEALHGLVLGGVKGHNYRALNSDVERGRITRQDVQTDVENFAQLMSGRIDTLLISRSTLLYYLKHAQHKNLYVSDSPLYEFGRHLLVTDALEEAVSSFLAEFIEALPSNPEWQILLFRYGLKPMASGG